MSERSAHKPSLDEWLSQAEIVITRLTEAVRIYKRPPYIDVFMADGERQRKTDDLIKLMHRIHGQADQADMSLDKGDHGYHQDEEVIEGLQILFRETLYTLPWVSTDMQKLLKSPWLSNFPNQMAHDLFYGQKDQAEGIGSGHIEHGRLPESLFNLIEREKMGDGRNRPEESSRHEPQRRDGEARNRWGEQKSRFLRTAGRVE